MKIRRFLPGKQIVKLICLLITVGILCISYSLPVQATESNLPGSTQNSTLINEPGSAETPEELADMNVTNSITISVDGGNGEINGALRILLLLTLIAIAPFLLITITSFTRIIIVLHFTRNALNTQTAPPNQILIGLALFLTFFIMSPTIASIYTDAWVPYEAGELTQEEALEAGIQPLREFMYKETKTSDVRMFMNIARQNWDGEAESVPTSVLIPSFVVSELRTAFIIGFLIYIPFIVIDMVVASTLMSMGMMMLPPTTISMPFKILLFVLADGWSLVIGGVVKTFY